MKNQYSHHQVDRLHGNDAPQSKAEKEEKEQSILDKLKEQLRKIRELKEQASGNDEASER
jgi:hypothetical protein